MANDEGEKQEIRQAIEEWLEKIIKEKRELQGCANLADWAASKKVNIEILKSRIADIAVEQAMMRRNKTLTSEASAVVIDNNVEGLISEFVVADPTGVVAKEKERLFDILAEVVRRATDRYMVYGRDQLQTVRQASAARKGRDSRLGGKLPMTRERKKEFLLEIENKLKGLSEDQLKMLEKYYKPSFEDVNARKFSVVFVLVREIFSIFKDGYDIDRYSEFMQRLSFATRNLSEKDEQQYREIVTKIREVVGGLKHNIENREAKVIDLAEFKKGHWRGPENG